MNYLGDLFGRLHPLLVHLPIGFFLLFAALEIGSRLPRRRPYLPPLRPAQRAFVIAFLAVSSVVTALAGWRLSHEGRYDEGALAPHRGWGFAFAGCMLLLLAVHRWGRPKAYAAVFAAALVLVAVTSHFGGRLTHGSDYLLPVAAADRSSVAAIASATRDPALIPVFAGVVYPLLDQHCVGCHGASKSNGEFRADSWEHLMAGGKSGRDLQPGDADGSALVRRLRLPLAEKEHMPPKGKTQLRDEDVALIEWWIDAGAPADKKLSEIDVPPFVAEIVQSRFPALAEPVPDRAAMMAAAQKLEQSLQIIVRPLVQAQPWLAVNARVRGKAFDDAALAALAPIAPAIQRLDLGETAVTDAGLARLPAMRSLRRLNLDQTGIGDAGLAHVAQLKNLEYLNVYGTGVSDAGIGGLQSLKRLRALYVWQTKVTPAGVKALEEHLVDRQQARRWNAELATLQRRMAGDEFRADFGAPLPPPAKAPAAPPPVPADPPAEEEAVAGARGK